MAEAESRFKYQKYESSKQPGGNPECGRFSERRPFQTLEDHLKKDQKAQEIRLELFNLPIIAVVLPDLKQERKPDTSPEKKLTVWDLLLLILERIIEGAQGLLSSQAGKKG